jgi:hypothetical protein
MTDIQSVRRKIALLGIAFSACAAAIGVHAALGLAQAWGWLDGDYGLHEHPCAAIAALGVIVIAIGLGLLYALHLADSGPRSLPIVARLLRRQLGWKAVICVGIAAACTLFCLELGEQLVAHRFDGWWSAFGDSPGVAIALVVAASYAIVAIARALCTWLCCTHDVLARACFTLLRPPRSEDNVALRAALDRATPSLILARRESSRIHTKRGPPFSLTIIS